MRIWYVCACGDVQLAGLPVFRESIDGDIFVSIVSLGWQGCVFLGAGTNILEDFRLSVAIFVEGVEEGESICGQGPAQRSSEGS